MSCWLWKRAWLLGLALGATAGVLAAPAPPSRLRVTLPFGDRVRDTGMVAVVVDLEVAAPFTGTLVVRPDARGGIQVPQAINVGAGHFRYEVACPYATAQNFAASHGEEAIRVELRNAGNWLVEEQRVPLQPLLADNTNEGEREPPFVVWLGAATPPPAVSAAVGTTVAWLKPAATPHDARLFATVDLLVVGPGGGDRLDAEQAAAIRDWVRSGGRLLLAADSLTPSREDGPLGRAFNLTRPAAPERTFTVATHEFPRRGLALAGRAPADDQLYTGLSVGLGGVALLATDLDPALASDRALDLLRQTLKETAILPGTVSGPVGGMSYRYTGQRTWADALREATGLEPIPGWVILLYLLAFLALVTVGEYLVLRRFHRLHWTWVTTPATVAVFCLCASLISTAVRGTRARLACVTLHDYAADGQGRHSAVACFVPAAARAVNATLGRETLVTPLPHFGQLPEGSLDLGRGTLTFGGPVWAPVFLAATVPHAEPAPLTAELHVAAEQIRGEVTGLAAGQAVVLYWRGNCYRPDAPGKPWVNVTGAHGLGSLPPEFAAGLQAPRPAALIPTPYVDAEHACLLTLVPDGRNLEFDVRRPRLTAHHLVRQVVRLSAKGPPP